jgi:predicted TIM-barrel fold metal-dependent hydrolase
MGNAPAAGGGKPYRIDVHHHVVPPAYSAALKANGIRDVRWTIRGSIEDMDKSGIATGVTSVPPPGASFGDAALARKVARDANEYAARLVGDYPGRFGMFAAIPLRDIEGSMKEIEFGLDTLKADGIGLMTSYGGKYLGDAAFWPVLEELNRRKAVVYTHPTSPLCCSAIIPNVSVNTIEGPVDTTRTMASLLFGGAAARYPDIRWIFSHGGGVMPFLLSRFQRQEAEGKDTKRNLPDGLLHELHKFYFETAQGIHPGALAALMKIAPVSQVLYGTDYPFRPGAEVINGLAQYGFSTADLRAIDRDNALRLLPRLNA